VDLSLTSRVLNLPHPLFADNVDLNCILRRRRLLKIDFGRPPKNGHGNQEGNDGPKCFELMRPGNGTWDFVRSTPAITKHEKDQRRRDQQGKEQRDAREVEIESIYFPRKSGRTIRNKWNPGLH